MNNKNYNTEKIIEVFNSPIEIGLRALIILNTAYPKSLDLNRLIIYDYFLIHSNDVDKSKLSIHPNTPHRSGEIILKRKIMQQGIDLLVAKELLNIEYTLNGIYYTANELSGYLINHFESDYFNELEENSKWIIDKFSAMSDFYLNEFVNRNVKKWGSEFAKESGIRGGEIE